LDAVFGLHLPEAASLWPTIVARHEQLFAGSRVSNANPNA
jgi:hypothetical protein